MLPFNLNQITIRALFGLFFLSLELNAFPIDLSKSEFYIREGFKEDWVKAKPEKCTECKKVSFTDEAFKSIRIKKVFPEKFEAANKNISLEERLADTFTIGTSFYIEEIPAKQDVYGIFLERIGINWEIYLNGQLLKSEMYLDSSGRVAIHKATRYPLVPIPSEFFKQGENHLYIRITGDIRDTYLAVFLDSPEIDIVENLTFRQFDVLRFIIQTSYLILALLYFILFILHPEQKFNLWFSFGLLLYGLYRFFDSHLVFLLIENSKIQQNLFSMLYLSLSGVMIFFYNYMIDDKAHWISKLTLFLCLALSTIKLYLPHAYTFPFLLNISGNASLFAYGYIIFYRIGYIGFKYFIDTYKENRKLKIRYAFFNSIKYSWNTKIEFVLLLFICPAYSSFIMDYSNFTKYEAHYYASDFSFLIFYGLMAIFTYRRKFLLVEQHKRELEKLHWEKETEKLRNELAIKEEREKIFADIHDNLGGKLLDLSFQLEKIQPQATINYEFKRVISEQIREVLKSLRNRLLVFEDTEKIEENFIEGIQNFLIRRYSLADRKIQFSTDSNFENLKLKKIASSPFLNIIQELVNNDLKYGSGISNWKFSLEDNIIYLQFSSLTNWNQTQVSVGNGHKTIEQRVKELNGGISQKIENGRYLAHLKLPL